MLVGPSAAQVSRRTCNTEKTLPGERIVMCKADLFDALRNVRVDPDQAHNFNTQSEIW